MVIDTDMYERSHGSKPARADVCLWVLESKTNGKRIELTDTWTNVKTMTSNLGLSDWLLLP